MKIYFLLFFNILFLNSSCLEADWENLVYLATYPRSGNHWMRYLIEEATGIATGADHIDPDPPHNPKRYPWGGFCPDGGYSKTRRYPEKDEIYVVKTHYPLLTNQMAFSKKYKKTIRIIRHPLDSFFSWIVYTNKNKEYSFFPRAQLTPYLNEWIQFQSFWDKQPNVYSIRYEDLLNDPFNCLKMILKEIGYDCSEEDIYRAVLKYPPQGKPLKHSDKFSPRSKEVIKSKLKPYLEKYNYSKEYAF